MLDGIHWHSDTRQRTTYNERYFISDVVVTDTTFFLHCKPEVGSFGFDVVVLHVQEVHFREVFGRAGCSLLMEGMDYCTLQELVDTSYTFIIIQHPIIRD